MTIKTLFSVALRNLLRQKRRNIFLGLGVAIGITMLVIAGSFTKGLKDVIINKMLVGMSGHIQIAVIGNVNDMYGRGRGYFRDKSIIESIIPDYTNEIDYYNTDASAFVRLLGNKKSELVQIVGVEINEGFLNFLKVVEGNPWDLTNTAKYENPMSLTVEKAKFLRVKLYDKVSASFQTLRGQMQTARFTVVALSKAESSFMNWVAFVPYENMRKLLDFKPYEVGSYTIVLKDIKKAIPISLELREKLKPSLFAINTELYGKKIKVATYWRRRETFNSLTNNIKIVSSLKDTELWKDGILLPKKFNIKVGSEIEFTYKTRFEGPRKIRLKVNGIYESDKFDNLLLINEKEFYKIFAILPAKEIIDRNFVPENSELAKLFGTEWVLMPRVKTSEELTKLYEDMKQNPIYADKILITTLYESSSMFLNFLAVMNVVALVFASFLFLIVMVGLANTLRITIRERTREIGTMRAIGAQRKDIKRLFLAEVFLLILISGLIGIIFGVIITKLLGLIPFKNAGIFEMFLVKRRLNLVIDWGWNIFSLVFVIIIGLITAYFPSKRAAKLHPAVALRHYE
ncbi:MAG: FtsX-like permease family protein [Brevinematales bacterium]